MSLKKIKTEHSGSKKSESFRGKRVDAKNYSKRKRRINAKEIIRAEIADL